MMDWNHLAEQAVALGAFKAGVIPISDVSFEQIGRAHV